MIFGTSSPSPVGLPDRLAVVFGSEGMGVSETMINAADIGLLEDVRVCR